MAEKVNCQSQVLKFEGRGYFEIPHKLISSEEDIGFTIELSFKTKDSNAPLFYKEGRTGDKISIELKNGKVLLEIIYKALDKSVILQSFVWGPEVIKKILSNKYVLEYVITTEYI